MDFLKDNNGEFTQGFMTIVVDVKVHIRMAKQIKTSLKRKEGITIGKSKVTFFRCVEPNHWSRRYKTLLVNKKRKIESSTLGITEN